MNIKDVLFLLLVGCMLSIAGSLVCVFFYGNDITMVGYILMIIGLFLIGGAAAEVKEAINR